jgi:choice-of-anchor C domain-containing protein
MKKIFLAAGIAALALAAAAPAGAVAIVNGSFENASVNPGAGFTTLGNGSTAIDGWVVGGLGVDYIGGYWQAADGVRSIDLSGNNKGGISQVLNGLTVGQVYTVHFDLAGNPDGGSPTKVAVASDGGSQSSVFFFPQAGNTKADMGWTPEMFSFTATDTSAKLTFSATVNDAFGPALDNVSITGGVPEPASWALMIMGFGGVGAAMRSRRRAQAVMQTA